MRLRLEIAYDGRAFAGWQSQKSGDAVQDLLEREVAAINGHPVRLHGAGRTDAGVHAVGQVAHLDVEKTLPAAEWERALNARLPGSVRVLRVRPTTPDFHARYDAVGKVYRYRISTARILMPLELGTVWHLPRGIDLERLRAAVSLFEGTHDFASFSANRGKAVRDSTRTLTSVRVSVDGPRVSLTFEGSGFLYRMVRMLVGSAIKVGQGKAELVWIRQLLREPRTGAAGFVAPAEGLTLVRVRY